MDNPEAQPMQPQPAPEGDIQNLYDSVKPYVWRLYLDEADNPDRNANLTAFAVGPGLLMTCGHGNWLTFNRLRITAKCLTGVGTCEGYVVAKKLNCDLVIVQIKGKGVEEMKVGRFGSGRLEVGESIMVFGHPWHYFASGMVGHNLYPCVDNLEFDFDDNLTCENYLNDPLPDPPKFRIMGHAWNLDIFNWAREDPKNTEDLTFEENLLANCPIIHAAGMICGPGSSGAPVFNLKGEIVGLHVYGIKNFEVCIHVAAVNAFLEHYLVTGGDGGGLEGGKEAGSSKKRARGRASQQKRRRSRHR